MRNNSKCRDVVSGAVMSEIVVNDFEFDNFNLNHVTMIQLVKLTGKSRQQIHYWCNCLGMPQNDDYTFDLQEVNSWYTQYLSVIKTSKKTALSLTEIFR